MPDDKNSNMTTVAERNAELFRDGFTLEHALRRGNAGFSRRDDYRLDRDDPPRRNPDWDDDDDYVMAKR